MANLISIHSLGSKYTNHLHLHIHHTIGLSISMFTFKEGRPQHYLYSVSIQYKEEEEMKEFSILLPKESLKGHTIVGINCIVVCGLSSTCQEHAHHNLSVVAQFSYEVNDLISYLKT